MCAIAAVPSSEQVMPDTPLRLGVAAALAFPDGSMTASGLRREAARGRLLIERIAGKDYTTLASIERMRELCRVEAKVSDSGSARRAGMEKARIVQPGSSSMVNGMSPQDALRMKLQKRKTSSPGTLPRNTSPHAKSVT